MLLPSHRDAARSARLGAICSRLRGAAGVLRPRKTLAEALWLAPARRLIAQVWSLQRGAVAGAERHARERASARQHWLAAAAASF